MKNPTSHSLENISGNKSEGDGIERRRMARFSLSHEQFRLSRTGKVFGVSDLSLDGMALRILEADDLLLFPLGSVFDGLLNLGGEKVSIQARVKRILPEAIGCQLEALGDQATVKQQGFLDPLRLGSELKLMPSTDATTAWFHGPSGADLVVKRGVGSQSAMTEFVFTAMGHFVRWEAATGLTTGKLEGTATPDERMGLLRLETLAWTPDSQPDPAKLNIAKTILLSSNLTQELKKELDRIWIAILP